MSDIKCDDCDQIKPDVVVTVCPYIEEMTGEEVAATLCQDCYSERVQGI